MFESAAECLAFEECVGLDNGTVWVSKASYRKDSDRQKRRAARKRSAGLDMGNAKRPKVTQTNRDVESNRGVQANKRKTRSSAVRSRKRR